MTQADTMAQEQAAPTQIAARAQRARRRISRVDRLKFELVRLFLLGWARLFSLKGLYLFGRCFGTIEYLINYKRRARYRRELRGVFPEGLPDARARQIVGDYFRRTRCDKLFYLIFDRLPREKILKRIRFEGREHVDAALQRGRGIYLMTSHHGSYHVAGLLMSLLGYRCAAVRDPNEGALRVYVQEKYAKTFPEYAAVRILYADAFPRDIFRAFQENRLVGTSLDVDRVRGPTLKTCPVQIFGQTRAFLTGTLQVALRCGTTIAPMFLVSARNFYYRIIVKPPFYVPVGDTAGEDPELVRRIMQAYADGIAAHVRAYPDHISRVRGED